jgi:curved DNA-binding protein CbpA
MPQKSPYEILGVSKNASEAEIKTAHRKAITKYHEDKVNARIKREGKDGTPEGAEILKDAQRQSTLINGAHEILKNKETREIYDNYGYDGLARHRNGDDPSGASEQGGYFDFGSASREFGEEGDIELSDDELFGDELDNRKARRDTKDVLKNAGKRQQNPFSTSTGTSIDDLLNEARGVKKKPEPKPSKPKNSGGSGGSGLLGDLAGKAGSMFNRAKDKAKETVDDLTHDNDSPANSGNNAQMAERLRDVMNELIETDGKLSSMSLKAVVRELSDIADTLDGDKNQPGKKHGLGR